MRVSGRIIEGLRSQLESARAGLALSPMRACRSSICEVCPGGLATGYAPGESVEWAVQPQTTEDPPGSGRFPVDESKPPETVVMERVPCGDLPQRTERAAEE